MLAPHQVELMFVLSTLLNGRRKIDVQRRLHSLRISHTLEQMGGRMEWDEVFLRIYRVVNGTVFTDGSRNNDQDDECTPKSAFRIQYLRLIHNLIDRDFINNHVSKSLFAYPTFKEEKGIISELCKVYMLLPVDSQYRFWISSTFETFLRGTWHKVSY